MSSKTGMYNKPLLFYFFDDRWEEFGQLAQGQDNFMKTAGPLINTSPALMLKRWRLMLKRFCAVCRLPNEKCRYMKAQGALRRYSK
mmetsp:Transcript_30047/g.92935  ORF Transcript_30047/g.92935 Transcript_30047/m.92935 type:complete len:86 (+) Transcript_30047:3325-3582(+)